MRNSIEISAELDAKVRELEACQDVAQRKTLADETAALTRELGDAQIEEAARLGVNFIDNLTGNLDRKSVV